MKKIIFLAVLIFTANVSAQTPRPFSIEGHRGARGWVPENTIPSFKRALEQGADTLELDVVISKDEKVVVSHEAWFSSIISLDKDGNRIAPEEQRENNIYKMTYEEVKLFDVGSIGNKDFPMQEKMKVVKPLLSELFTEIAKFVKANKLTPPRYNIEIKTEGVSGDDVYHPKMEPFVSMVYEVIRNSKMAKYVIVQSFDVRPLQELRRLDRKMPLALLVSNKDGIEKNLERLGFLPDTYSPHFSLVDTELVSACRRKSVKIIPWTINELADLERLKAFDLDGIITDYPDRAVKVFRK